MLRLIDPNATHEFVPKCEKDSENPTTFHVRPMSMRQSVAIAQAAKSVQGGDKEIQIDAICELIEQNVVQIDNATVANAEEFLEAASTPEAIGVVFEVFKFIQSLSLPTEAEKGN